MAGVEPSAVDDGQIVPAPDDAAIPLLQVDQFDRLARERRRLHEDPVPELGRLADVPAVQRLDPRQGGRRIGPPADRTRPRRHGVEGGRHIVPQRQVRDGPHHPPVQVRHHDLGREQVVRHRIGIGSLGDLMQDVFPIRRHRGVQIDRRRTDRPCTAVQRNQRQLASEIMIEQRLVARVRQQVLIGPHRRHPPGRLLDVRPCRRNRHVRRWTAPGRHRLDQQARTVGQPFIARPARHIDHRIGQLPGSRRGCVHDPQLQPRRPIHNEGQRLGVRREPRRREPRAAGQGHDAGLPPIHRLQAQSRQPRHPALGRAIVPGIDPRPRQPQHRLGQGLDAGQVRPIHQHQRPPVRAQHRRRRRLGVQNVRDRRWRLLIDHRPRRRRAIRRHPVRRLGKRRPRRRSQQNRRQRQPGAPHTHRHHPKSPQKPEPQT